MISLHDIVQDFAEALKAADSKAPQYRSYHPGIAPFPEGEAIKLIAQHMASQPKYKTCQIATNVSYPGGSKKKKCDMCVRCSSNSNQWDWAIEIKLLRFLGDNGKPNDNILTHILSPYEQHRSALTDCAKLAGSGLGAQQAILIYGFEHQGWPLEPAIQAFETLARARCAIGQRCEAPFDNLVHPVHKKGKVFGWRVF